MFAFIVVLVEPGIKVHPFRVDGFADLLTIKLIEHGLVQPLNDHRRFARPPISRHDSPVFPNPPHFLRQLQIGAPLILILRQSSETGVPQFRQLQREPNLLFGVLAFLEGTTLFSSGS